MHVPSTLPTATLQRFYNEVCGCGLVHHGGGDVVLLVRVYSTETPPFGLVYECVGNPDLKQYLRKEFNVERLTIVLILVPGGYWYSSPSMMLEPPNLCLQPTYGLGLRMS